MNFTRTLAAQLDIGRFAAGGGHKSRKPRTAPAATHIQPERRRAIMYRRGRRHSAIRGCLSRKPTERCRWRRSALQLISISPLHIRTETSKDAGADVLRPRPWIRKPSPLRDAGGWYHQLKRDSDAEKKQVQLNRCGSQELSPAPSRDVLIRGTNGRSGKGLHDAKEHQVEFQYRRDRMLGDSTLPRST